MSSIEMLPHQNGMSESLDSSEFSLIPEPSETDGEMEYSHLGTSTVFLPSTQDMSVEDVQKRLIELVEDNIAMKDALKTNNTMMKEQLSTITEWHNQMTTSMSKQQMTLTETLEKLEICEKENTELKKKVNESQEYSKFSKDAETYTNDENMFLSFEKIESECVNRKSQMVEFLKNQDIATNSLLDRIKLDQLKTVALELLSSSEEKDKRISEAETEVNNLKAEFEKCQKEIGSQKKELESKTSIIADMTETIKKLTAELAHEQQEAKREKTQHNETNMMLKSLQDKYNNAVKSSTNATKSTVQDAEEMEAATRMYLEKIDELTATNFDLEQKLDRRVGEAERLREACDAAMLEAEQIPILKAQAEEYKANLDNALLSKESAREEAERAKRDLAELHSFVTLCTNCGFASDLQSGLHLAQGLAQPPAPPPPEQQTNYNCPVCNFGFDNLQAAENHVNRCLDSSNAENGE